MTDFEIIGLYRDGKHEQAFNLIVDIYSERLYWHIRRFVCNHEDTDDLLQDVFMKIWAALPSFRGDARLFTWIYRIATNVTLNHLRKDRFKTLLSFENLQGVLERRIDEDPSFNGDKLQAALHKAIQALPEKQRLVFSLRYFDEMKYEDISAITRTSTGALKASYHHAYNKIRKELEEKFTER